MVLVFNGDHSVMLVFSGDHSVMLVFSGGHSVMLLFSGDHRVILVSVISACRLPPRLEGALALTRGCPRP